MAADVRLRPDFEEELGWKVPLQNLLYPIEALS